MGYRTSPQFSQMVVTRFDPQARSRLPLDSFIQVLFNFIPKPLKSNHFTHSPKLFLTLKKPTNPPTHTGMRSATVSDSDIQRKRHRHEWQHQAVVRAVHDDDYA